MRPLKLIITGFCSYARRTEIDFTEFGKAGLYLITGNTGSGKTTIFDAISYALYGAASGSYRTASMLRSDFASADDPTLVELTFELNGKTYNIKRNPSYQRRSKKGDGFVNESANAELTMPDGSIISGQSQVDKAIIEILRIEKSQFSQIVMLAQGDFQKLLNSDTKDRQEIFRRIFKTENYQIMQTRLNEKRKEINALVNETSLSLKQYFSETVCDKSDSLAESFEHAKEDSVSWEEKIKILENIIISDRKKEKEIEEKAESNKKELDKVKIELSELNDIKKALTELEEAEKNLKNKKEALVVFAKELEEAGQKKEAASKLEEEKILLENDLPKYQEVKNLSLQVKNLKVDAEKNESLIEKLTKSLETKEKDLESVKNQIKEISSHQDKLPELTERKNKTEQRLELLKALEKNYKELSEIQKNLEEAQKEYLQIRKAYERARKDFEEKNQAYLDGQAGILAENLQENQPCPVCGSLHHPSPAKKQDSLPDQEELKTLKESAEKLLQEENAKSQEASNENTKLEMKKQQVQETYLKLFGHDLSETVEEDTRNEKNLVNQQYKQLLDECQAEEKLQESKSKLEESLTSLEDEISSGKKQELELTNKKVQLSSEEKNTEANLKKISSGLKYESSEAAEEKIASLEKEISDIKKAFDQAQKNHSDCDKDISGLTEKIAQLKKSAKSEKTYDEKALLSRNEELEKMADFFESQKKELYSRLQTNQKAVENIRIKAKDLSEQEHKLTYVSELAATASGNLGQGKAKIMLETYVQMHYFDRIIAHANLRFESMSGGQYTLVRKVDADNVRSQSGLELNVIDHFKGTVRDVKTLSGGESFEASLSLALGLSDEIAQNAGGIKMDTMFVDEGFGTLDEDTLQKAYNALVGITEGNRLIGIISHVGSLKEKIDKQIVVHKEPGQPSSVTIKS